jgi:hypothetical protein
VLQLSRLAIAAAIVAVMFCALMGTASAATSSGLSIVVSPQSSWALGGDDLAAPGGPVTDGTTRLGGSITQHVGKWSLGISRGYIDFTLGRITNAAGQFVNPGFVDDAVDDAHLAYAFKDFTLTAGWHDRYRICCPAAHNNPVPVAEQYWYLQLDGGVGPVTRFGHIVSLSVNDAQVPHVGLPFYANPVPGQPAIPGQGSKNLVTFTGTITVPVDKKQTLAVWGLYANNFEYYYAYAKPTFYNNVTWGITKNFPANISYTASVLNYYQHNEGYPFIFPNTVNLTVLQMTLNVGIDM